jgi:hypothetical protein
MTMSKSTKQCKNIWNVYDGVPAKWGIVYLFLVFCWSNEILLIFLSRFIFHVLTYTCFCRYDHVIYTGTMQDDCYLWRHGQLSLHYCHLHRDYAGWLWRHGQLSLHFSLEFLQFVCTFYFSIICFVSRKWWITSLEFWSQNLFLIHPCSVTVGRRFLCFCLDHIF